MYRHDVVMVDILVIDDIYDSCLIPPTILSRCHVSRECHVTTPPPSIRQDAAQ